MKPLDDDEVDEPEPPLPAGAATDPRRSRRWTMPDDAPTAPFCAMIVPVIGAFSTAPSTAACADDHRVLGGVDLQSARCRSRWCRAVLRPGQAVLAAVRLSCAVVSCSSALVASIRASFWPLVTVWPSLT